MSVTTENAPVQGQTTLQENRAGEGVYASLFEKINLAPASRLGDINDFLDDAALSEAPAAERLTAAMQVFMERIRQSGQRVEKLDKTLIDHHIAELDFQISRQLDAVMHHQEFQQVESLWRGLKQLVDNTDYPWDTWTDSVLCDLRLLLKRLPGLEGLAWNDGTPFADEVTTAWIAEKVNEECLMYGDELATVVNGQADDVLLLESEAMEKGDTDGPEAALTWLQSRPGMDTPRHRWLIRLLMARVAEQYGRNEMALHLLGELTICAPQLTLGDWEPGLLFEIQARRLKLLRMKAGRSESDKTRLMPEMESLIAGLIAIDPARAMVLCG